MICTPSFIRSATKFFCCSLYASPTQVARGEVVNVSTIKCHRRNMYLVVDTTAPLPYSKQRKRNSQKNIGDGMLLAPRTVEKCDKIHLDVSMSSRDGGDELTSSSTDVDSMGTVMTLTCLMVCPIQFLSPG